MAKKKKAKSLKKVTKKTPVKKSKKKVAKKTSKKTAKKVSKKITNKMTKKVNKSDCGVAESVKAKETTEKPVKKPRKKRVTKAETLRLMQQEQLVKKWQSLYKKLDKIDTAKYNMRDKFNEETAISHKKLGWGFILSNVNDRLEVLFEDGIKNLISNYKS